MNTLQVGFARVNITPPLGCNMIGYFRKRLAEGVHDELEANAVAFACGESKAVVISVDHLGVDMTILNMIRHLIAENTGLAPEAVYIHCTHTHTGPLVDATSDVWQDREYYPLFCRKVADAATLALQDLQPAQMGYGLSEAKGIAFIRRYRMKDGSTQTNPGRDNPDVVGPMGETDDRVCVLRFKRENDNIVVASFGMHPDTVGSNKYSADWPGFVRRITEQAIPGCKCISLTAFQGDVNHVNLNRPEWYTPASKTTEQASHLGRVISGSIQQVYDKVRFVDVDSIKYMIKEVEAATNRATPEQLPEAHRIVELYNAGEKSQIPGKGMEKNTIITEALRMVRWENGPDSVMLPVSGIVVGNVAFLGLPGEPFTQVGLELKNEPGWDMVIHTCNTNGKQGYIPTNDAFGGGSYEDRASNFKAGIADQFIATGKEVLKLLRQ